MTAQNAQIAQLTAEVDTLKTALSRRNTVNDNGDAAARGLSEQDKDARIKDLERKLADLRG